MACTPAPKWRARRIEKKPEAGERFRQEVPGKLQEVVASRRQTGEAPAVRLWSMDESRFGLKRVVRRRITLKGVKPVAKVPHRLENFYLNGAVEPRHGRHFILEMPAMNRDYFQSWLEEFSLANPGALNIVIADNGGLHKAKKLVLPENVVRLFLPAYSPELNPCERFWEDLKGRLTRSVDESLDELSDEWCEMIQGYEVGQVQSLTCYPYIRDCLNALSL